jgi:hypothetical protein
LLRLFRNNSPFTVLILFIFALLVKMRVLTHPIVPAEVPRHFLYNHILKALFFLFGDGPFKFTLLALVILFVQALYIKSLTSRHKLYPKYTYIPAFVYLLVTSIYSQFNYFSETLIINWLIIGAMDIMLSFTQTNQPRKLIYNAALLLSLAALFQFTFLVYFFLLLLCMMLFRAFSIGEWAVAIMGYATPFYFFVCILFLFDRFYYFHQWPHVGFFFARHPHISSPLNLIITLAGLFVLFASGMFAMQKNVAMGNIYARRDWVAISFFLITSVVVAVLTDNTIESAWLIALPALSIVISHALLLEKNRRFSNFIFYFSLFYLFFCLVVNE